MGGRWYLTCLSARKSHSTGRYGDAEVCLSAAPYYLIVAVPRLNESRIPGQCRIPPLLRRY
ncbi:hypothetical protein E2C01_043375 [Portunus trituberculatus]|uniref:Uncharacterized protein n=1 Tax=Portunus trituberculatus TaxID=210409 RepID=A0A5B7FXD9_PORTR|nr:hypothetical protein [Portunus trituberculatus]